MADFQKTIVEVPNLPQLRKSVALTAGQKLSDDVDVLEFAQRTVPVGKVAMVSVRIKVTSLIDESEVGEDE